MRIIGSADGEKSRVIRTGALVIACLSVSLRFPGVPWCRPSRYYSHLLWMWSSPSSSYRKPTISIPFIPISDLGPEIANPAILQSLMNTRKISACSRSKSTHLHTSQTRYNLNLCLSISILRSLDPTMVQERQHLVGIWQQ